MDKLSIGGQAVIEGVMMRSKNYYSIAIRKPDKTISVKRERIKQKKLSNIFFIRGIIALYETLEIGFKSIMHSANEASEEGEKLGKKEMYLTVGFSVLFGLLLFVALPFYLSSIITKDNSITFNIIDGVIRVGIFILYILLISFIPDVKTMYRYHGAEHMAIHAYENGKKLAVNEVRKFSTLHPRCGTSFLLFVLLISIFAFSTITSESWAVRILSRVLLLPVIAGLSYELLKVSAKHKKNILFRAIIIPGLLLQKITTSRPDDGQIEVAIRSLNDVVEAESISSSQLPQSPQKSHRSTVASP